MDYEKKYNEIVGQIKKAYLYAQTDSTKAVLEEIFPELKESEDERIKEAIIATIHLYYGEPLEDEAKEMLAWLEKQGEKKPDDKVEPKFKVGDWVVNKGHSYLIADIDFLDNRYLFEIGGYTHEQLNWEYIENVDSKYHLWTIQDAKAGDVLACEYGWTCIFKTLVNEETFSSYCFMDKTKWFCETGSECHTLNKKFMKAYNGEIKPATKEQRDTLFAKMHEAGYMWDSESKQLLSLKAEPSGEQKPAWSEEDEEMFDAIIADIQFTQKAHTHDDNQAVYEREIDWLKSLKKRIGG